MVLDRKTNFFLGKRCFWRKTQTFSCQSHLFPRETKTTIFLESGRTVSQNMFLFFLFFCFFVFPRKILVFLPKTIFFLGKRWFFHAKTIFSLEESWFCCPKESLFLGKTKTNLESVRAVSQKMAFFGFVWFSLGKVGF